MAARPRSGDCPREASSAATPSECAAVHGLAISRWADTCGMSAPPPAVLVARHGHTDRMARWQEYKEEAAALFRSLGLEATTDERLDGVRGAHDVDVVVRSRRAGLEQFWVVECKWRRRRVEKLHVTALAEIVRDVGADRGVLLSEVGFQGRCRPNGLQEQRHAHEPGGAPRGGR